MDSNNNFDINDEQESSQLGNNTRSTYIRFESEYSDEFATNDNDFRPDITNTASSLPRYQPELVGVERHERAKPPVFLTLNLPDFCGCLSEIRINSKTASVIAIATNIIIHTIFLFNHVKTGGDVYNNWPLKIEFCIEWTFVLIALLGILFSRSNLVLPYIIVVILEVIEELVMLIIDFRRYPNEKTVLNDYIWRSVQFSGLVILGAIELYALIKHWRYLKSAYPLRQSLFSEIRNKYSRF